MNHNGKIHANFMADAVKAAAARKIELEQNKSITPQDARDVAVALPQPRTAVE